MSEIITETMQFTPGTQHPLTALFQHARDFPRTVRIRGKRSAMGMLERSCEYGIAIVGTREPQARSVAVVRKAIDCLRGTDLIIVSGFARGIDATAHVSALECGLPTIAILGAGLDVNYPSAHATLRERIIEQGGLLVSEFPDEIFPAAHQFLRRNRLIAAWSKATWVAEAGFRSGALNTARWTREYHRMCFAIPCFPGEPGYEGNQVLLDRDHALPFWGAHSLGAVWLDVSAMPSPSQRAFPFKEAGEESPLVKQVGALQALQGAARVEELLLWAGAEGWPPEKFFAELQNCLKTGSVLEENGLLLKNPLISD